MTSTHFMKFWTIHPFQYRRLSVTIPTNGHPKNHLLFWFAGPFSISIQITKNYDRFIHSTFGKFHYSQRFVLVEVFLCFRLKQLFEIPIVRHRVSLQMSLSKTPTLIYLKTQLFKWKSAYLFSYVPSEVRILFCYCYCCGI